jgi:hypothetical protein
MKAWVGRKLVQEVRLVFKLPTNGSELENLKLRTRIPYIELKSTTELLPIQRVIVEPASKSFDQIYALKILLIQFGHGGAQGERSRFELR